MNILCVNYRYYISGGPERYLFNVSRELLERGHTIMPFSIHYTHNFSTPYAKYFVEPLGSRDEVYFDDQKMTPATLYRTIKRLFYDRDVERAISLMIRETRPDIAYVLHFLRKLSPAVLVGIKRHNLPVVVRLSDYALLCPQMHCLRNSNPCTLCIEGSLFPSLRYHCVKDSYSASLLNALATWYHQWRHYFDLIDVFIVSNSFMYDMMLQAGYPEKRLQLIPTFTDINTFNPRVDRGLSDYIIYAGRLEDIKGVHILIDAFAQLRKIHPDNTVRLKICGTGSRSYQLRLEEQIISYGLQHAIDIMGFVDARQISALLSNARFSIVPSVCYENLPNAVLESFACGTPVIVSNIGCLPDCIQEGETGLTFTAGDCLDLTKKMEILLYDNTLADAMARKARIEALEKYGPARHIENLLSVFEHALI